jgi:thiamine monophosphate kinase
MGAMPYWAMLALTFPSDHDWLAAFAKGFDLAQRRVSLIGGDTARTNS